MISLIARIASSFPGITKSTSSDRSLCQQSLRSEFPNGAFPIAICSFSYRLRKHRLVLLCMFEMPPRFRSSFVELILQRRDPFFGRLFHVSSSSAYVVHGGVQYAVYGSKVRQCAAKKMIDIEDATVFSFYTKHALCLFFVPTKSALYLHATQFR